MTRYIRNFSEIENYDFPFVGARNLEKGKSGSLLQANSSPTPSGFAIVTRAYQDLLLHNNIKGKLREVLLSSDKEKDIKKISKVGKELILKSTYPYHLQVALLAACELLKEESQGHLSLNLFTSYVMDKAMKLQLAPSQIYLDNISCVNRVLDACLELYASLYEEDMIKWSFSNEVDLLDVKVSLGIQVDKRINGLQ